ncbi:MAG: AAA family ATPase [Methanomassiliicoccales archaeon]|nr:MAG: AAA family ATPase [Methanomassiliicoccales archaeon]
MKTLFLGSVVERSGKTMITLGLALNHPGKVGYYKPFRERLISRGDRVIDQDTYLMRKVLNLKRTEEELSPLFYDVSNPVSMDDVIHGFNTVKCDCDEMFVEGTREVTTGYLNDLSGMAIAQALHADMVLISTAQPTDLDKIGMFNQLLKSYNVRFRGVILNQSEDDRMAKLLERKGITVLGRIPTLRQLRTFTVREVKEALDADVVVADDRLNKEVERVMVGAMTPETAITVLRRHAKKAIITGGDRSDIQMAALQTDTSCLVLTGGLYPAATVVAKAYETGVPILVTRQDTLEAAEKVEHLIARIDPDHQDRLDLVRNTVREHVDIRALFE